MIIMVNILETLMLVCFGAAWPASIYKSWKCRTAKGKSLSFLVIVLIGYFFGICKVLLAEGTGGFLLIPYTINIAMVICDTVLYFRNRRIDLAASNPIA